MKGNSKLAVCAGAVIAALTVLLLTSWQAGYQQCLPDYQKAQSLPNDPRDQQSLPNDPSDQQGWSGHPRDQQGLTDDPRDQQSLPDDHPNLVFLRKFGRVKNLPTEQEMQSMSDKEIHYIYHSYLDNTEFRCNRKLRLGNTGDGGYEVCDDYLYRPIKPCLVYSFGIRNDFSFDDAAGKMYGCNVYSFDPSMASPTHKRSEKVWFYKVGLGGNDGKSASLKSLEQANQLSWDVKSLTDIKALLKHSNTTLDLLKIDIEFSEWHAMENIIARGELAKVRQLLIECHSDLQHPAAVRQTLPTLRKIEALGFRRYFTHLISYHPTKVNNDDIFPVERRCCYEMGFVNSRMARDGWKEHH